MAWINAHVARGDFPSAEEAVRQLVDERIAERSIEDDDLLWAKPLVDDAMFMLSGIHIAKKYTAKLISD